MNHIKLFEQYNDGLSEWFGESKVVDSEGNPLLVYHGSKSKFNTYDKDKISTGGSEGILQYGHGFYFSNRKDIAVQYGENVHSVYLKIENPIHMNHHNDEVPDNLINFCVENYPSLKTLSDFEYKMNVGSVHRILRFLQKKYHNTDDVLKELGYDGIFDLGDYASVYVVFVNEQIKIIK